MDLSSTQLPACKFPFQLHQNLIYLQRREFPLLIKFPFQKLTQDHQISILIEAIRDQAKIDQMELDRISALPDPLAHHILSFLPNKDAARTAVLSKRWEMLCLTSPILDFDEKCFHRGGLITCRSRFLVHMQKSLTQRHDDLEQVRKLRISTTLPRDDELDRFVDRLLALAIKGKVRELDLNIKNYFLPVEATSHDQHYVLPEIVLSSGSSLVSLMLEDCHIGKFDAINLPSLKNLTVRSVDITEEMLFKLASSCPFLENLKVESCKGLKTLKITSPTLKCMIVSCCKGLSAFEFDVPSMDSFSFNGFSHSYHIEDYHHDQLTIGCSEILKFKTSSANNLCFLKSLVLLYVKLKDETFTHLLSRIPNIESLSLRSSMFERMPCVVLEKLKHFEVKNCDCYEPVEINAPNLDSLVWSGGFRHCKLKHDGMGFNSLRTLSLFEYSSLTDESLKDLLSSCPLLENLILKSCRNLKHIHITSSTLKRMVVDSCLYLEDGSEVDVSKLVYFKYIGPLVEFHHMATSSQLKAEVNLISSTGIRIKDYIYLVKLRNLLRNLSQAKVLKLVTDKTEYLVIPKETCPFPPIDFLRQLTVVTRSRISLSYVDLLLGVLHISFCREALLIDLRECSIHLKFQGVPRDEESELLNSEWENHNCLKDHLNEVRLKICEGNSKEMDLIKFLLGTATFLKSMLITFIKETPNGDIPMGQPKIITTIMNYPKASPFVEIVFK